MSTNQNRYDSLSRMGSPDYGGPMVAMDRAPIVETAEIVRVDPTLFVVDAVTKGTGRTARNIEIGGSAVHRHGGTMTSIPEVGDKCLIVWPSDDVIPKILTYLPYFSSRDGARAGRKSMRPGDKLISTSSGSHLHMHAGGIVDIASNPLTRRLYIPVLNTIKDFFENYEMSSPAGRFRWENRRDSITPTGTETEARWEIRAHASGDPTILIRKGSVFEVQDMPEEARLHDEVLDEVTGGTVYRVTVDSEGNIFVYSAGDYRETTAGERLIAAAGGVVLSATQLRNPTYGTPSLSRGYLRVSNEDGTQLSRATERAVLGDTQLRILQQYTAQIGASLSSLLSALGTASGAAVDPGLKSLGASLTPAVASNLQAQATAQQFPSFLALDTKLS